jgi:5-methylcytosine-specific restriction endonuclease McrA
MKTSLNIPQSIRDAVYERDGGICQGCGYKGVHLHHIVLGGMGSRRVHAIENLVTLCPLCHEEAHSNKSVQESWVDWSIQRYGCAVIKIKYHGQKWREYL